ncbi:hypothetical protein [Actinokineospora iranica]|uniref:Uncharacterized protein n=1 Tax=Actinokineospora iranica TaxID=1271860 RepID=A0A1G6X6T8_9PSEU|nr:hypothetical protein [Actinokineospora iranica]SDD73829.1 hypothetical protein SAMN05216174_116136 [Actinokineospora iranica]
MLIIRVPLIPGFSQIFIGDGRTGPEADVPEWDNESENRGYAASRSTVLVATGDRSDYVVVDVLNEVPAPDAIVLFTATLRLRTLVVSPPDEVPTRPVLFLPDEADWRTVITVDSSESENIRRIFVHLPELADPRLPDGL